MRRKTQAVAAWDRAHPVKPTPAEFTGTILHQLRASDMSVSALSRRTGLSRRYLRTILDGDAVPHPMHWDAFRLASRGHLATLALSTAHTGYLARG